jgi:ferric-dicitrate binding protein FerR (iron transport regulator)
MKISHGWNGFGGLLIGILIASNGIVEVQRNNVWVAMKPGEQVNTGDRIRTGTFSSASVQLEPGKIITLDQGTQIQVRDSNGTPLVQLESGDMRVFSATDIQVAAKDTLLQSVERPLDMQVGLQADRLNVMVFSGAVRNGAVTIFGAEDSSVRTYTAGRWFHHEHSTASPSVNIYPYYMYGNPVPPGGDPSRPPAPARPH